MPSVTYRPSIIVSDVTRTLCRYVYILSQHHYEKHSVKLLRKLGRGFFFDNYLCVEPLAQFIIQQKALLTSILFVTPC